VSDGALGEEGVESSWDSGEGLKRDTTTTNRQGKGRKNMNFPSDSNRGKKKHVNGGKKTRETRKLFIVSLGRK